MPSAVGVRLRRKCRIYDFEAGEFALSPGDWVIVETSRGQDVGQVVQPPREIPPEELQGELKPVVRLATAADLRRMERYREREEETLKKAQEKVEELDLPMRLVAAEYTYNGRSLTIYFTSEKRVDFRELVRKLARNLRARIELRQVGARDEARLLGGIGPCGRLLCCETFLCDFQRISVRMAKEQDLPLSPMKISGVCGRLLCCLNYEYEQYREIKALLPRVGEEVVTLHGRGVVTSRSVPKETATVEVRPGLAVEATIEELAQAVEMEAKGQLPAQKPPYLTIPLELGVETQAQNDQPAPTKKKRRRRRRKKGQPQAKATSPGTTPARPRSAQTASASKSPSTREKQKSRRRSQPRSPQSAQREKTGPQEQPAPAPSKQSSPIQDSGRHRPSRRRRRPRPSGDSSKS